MFKKGFTLIEALIALFLLTTGTLGAFSLIQRTVSFTSISSSRLTASYLAQEGIEIIRNIRDDNWLISQPWDQGLGTTLNKNVNYDSSSFSDLTDNLVLWQSPIDSGWRHVHYDESSCAEGGDLHYPDGDSCQVLNTCCLDTKFSRHIEISYPGANIMEIKSVVEWQERGRTHQVTAQTRLHNWY